MSKSFAAVTITDLQQENADLRAKLAAAFRCVSTAFPTTPDELTALVNQIAEITHVPAAEATVWSGYDDDERGFPLFATREQAQAYAEHRFRKDYAEELGVATDDFDISFVERKAYTEAHDGRAGLYDLHTDNGSTGYVVCEHTVHQSAADAIRKDAAEAVA